MRKGVSSCYIFYHLWGDKCHKPQRPQISWRILLISYLTWKVFFFIFLPDICKTMEWVALPLVFILLCRRVFAQKSGSTAIWTCLIDSPGSVEGFSSSQELDENRQEKDDPAKDTDSLQHQSWQDRHRSSHRYTVWVLTEDWCNCICCIWPHEVSVLDWIRHDQLTSSVSAGLMLKL